MLRTRATAPKVLERTRKWAAYALALYFIAVFPANIQNLVNAMGGQTPQGLPSTTAYYVFRLVLQPVFIWWVLFAGRVITWPLGARRQAA